MVRLRRLLIALALPMVILAWILLVSEPSAGWAADTGATPRLAVLVVFDQMGEDYLERWHDLFGEGGFRRLRNDGAWFPNCNYPYAFTVTGPGHASFLTGCSPDRHGIVENDWFDQAQGRAVSCVASERYPAVPGRAGKGASPELLLAPGVGDVLKGATAGKARVVSLSLKDRSAVLMGGKRADGCYWMDGGGFETSSYYRDRLPEWVAYVNRARSADRWVGKEWTRLANGVDYASRGGPDDQPGEGRGFGQGRTFPHPFPARAGKAYYSAVYTSPAANELLLELAKRAIDGEALGTRETPDLLCVSFSGNDSVGHCWGPDSQEVLDVTLRSDRVLKGLLDYLDARVGRGRYVLAVTADHGVCPLPEVSLAAGREAGRIDPGRLAREAEAYLEQTFGSPEGRARWVRATAGPWFYLDRELIRRRGRRAEEAERVLAAWLVKQRGIQAAYTRTQLTDGSLARDAAGRTVQRSFRAERCGDVAVVTKPYYILWPELPGTGTTHGSLHSYDTHVPLFFYGPGIGAGERREAVTPQAVAAVFSRCLDLKAPADAEAEVPGNLRLRR